MAFYCLVDRGGIPPVVTMFGVYALTCTDPCSDSQGLIDLDLQVLRSDRSSQQDAFLGHFLPTQWGSSTPGVAPREQGRLGGMALGLSVAVRAATSSLLAFGGPGAWWVVFGTPNIRVA